MTHTRTVLALCSVAALAACSTTDPARSLNQAGTQVASVATTPLSDLNIVHAEIPPVLRVAAQAPYALPASGQCSALGADVQALDAALGPDLDSPPAASQTSLIERGADTVGTAALGSLQSAADGVLPFRSWIRKLTGAERYSKQVAAAITAGAIRRAYLKGLGKAAGCEAPAAPKG